MFVFQIIDKYFRNWYDIGDIERFFDVIRHLITIILERGI